MVKRNAIATKLTKVCTQTQKRAFDVAVRHKGHKRHIGHIRHKRHIGHIRHHIRYIRRKDARDASVLFSSWLCYFFHF